MCIQGVFVYNVHIYKGSRGARVEQGVDWNTCVPEKKVDGDVFKGLDSRFTGLGCGWANGATYWEGVGWSFPGNGAGVGISRDFPCKIGNLADGQAARTWSELAQIRHRPKFVRR